MVRSSQSLAILSPVVSKTVPGYPLEGHCHLLWLNQKTLLGGLIPHILSRKNKRKPWGSMMTILLWVLPVVGWFLYWQLSLSVSCLFSMGTSWWGFWGPRAFLCKHGALGFSFFSCLCKGRKMLCTSSDLHVTLHLFPASILPTAMGHVLS